MLGSASHWLGIRPWEWQLLEMRDAGFVVAQCEQIEAESRKTK